MSGHWYENNAPIGIERLHDVCKARHLGYSAGWRASGDYFVEVRVPNTASGFNMEGKPAAAIILAAVVAAEKMGHA